MGVAFPSRPSTFLGMFASLISRVWGLFAGRAYSLRGFNSTGESTRSQGLGNESTERVALLGYYRLRYSVGVQYLLVTRGFDFFFHRLYSE